ncbi:lipid-A-disaccharide synthase [Pelagibacterium lentulum]|uniref:Lipid-A-disaccharide synthase n=1 Tax=Pelagibacterium lentulum TaxID=2029865 RepID=A0A916RDM8_9HYPH|nr:lipid-A-disaccharide synthase [Pelagibacterium lentulum]GGA52400.1 lipid-A-disaccharide synthase [Pelagibacterium lentulum]
MTNNPAKLFILAGESSGDAIGADLIAGLKARQQVEIIGVGGEKMQAEGLASLFPIHDLAVMGYRDVLLRLPLLLWRARQTVNAILASQPDIVVLIDAQVFSQVVASRLRKRSFEKPIVLYVAPSVWAWKPERARKIAPLYDEVLAVLPFEPSAMEQLGGPRTSYVGHPALARIPMREKLPANGPLLLLPGSRTGEITKHLPLMRAVGEMALAHARVDELVILSTRAQHARIEAAVAKWPVPARIVSEANARQTVLNEAVAAFAVSGTVTLELALAGIPHAITYIAEGAQVRMFQKAITRFVGLPNILAGAEIVPEILFAHRAEPERAIHAVKDLLDNQAQRQSQLEAFKTIRATMEKGAPEAPLSNPVDRIGAWINAR